MEFNKSSLLGLKAELLRKQQEVANAKASSQGYVRPPPKVVIKTISEKVNEGVEKRDLLDKQEQEVPSDLLKKSQQMLLAKTKLYEELASKRSSKDSSSFLVNFERKSDTRERANSEPEMNDSSDSDSDWAEFTDCLGRTRRCLKEDLEEMKKRDDIFQRSNLSSTNKQESRTKQTKLAAYTESNDLLSGDMQRELLRQKWEKEEEELQGARDIHYQDVLFDEARQHGVGYYGFSTDETERKRQQQELRDMRKQTEEEKQAQAIARDKKKNQRKERLRAARRRKRERLGLPPGDGTSEEESEEEPAPPPPVVEDSVEDSKNVRKPTQVREWDLGKEGVSRVLSQDEWVKKKRDERVSEFAPPTDFSKNKKYKEDYGSSRKKLKRPVSDSDTEDDSEDDVQSSKSPETRDLDDTEKSPEVHLNK